MMNLVLYCYYWERGRVGGMVEEVARQTAERSSIADGRFCAALSTSDDLQPPIINLNVVLYMTDFA